MDDVDRSLLAVNAVRYLIVDGMSVEVAAEIAGVRIETLRSRCQMSGIRMAQSFHKNTVERNYLDQMRDLVLRVTSNLDCTIFLFGSRARGEQRRSSDIDIGFSGLSEPEFTKVRDGLLSELEESVIPHHVDLVNIDMASSDFRDVAMEKVIVWKQKC